MERSELSGAITRLGIDPNKPDPVTV
jgi:hypothetical protein